MVIRELEEGRGELTLFFDPAASRETRFHFEEYIYTHLMRWALTESVKVRRIISCEVCGFICTDQFISMKRERGFESTECPICQSTVSLLTEEELPTDIPPSVVPDIDRAADALRDLDTALSTLDGKIATGDFDVFLCHNSQDKKAVIELALRLKDRGILPWLDAWEIPPGTRWQRALEDQIKKVKTAAVFVGKNGIGPWQDMEQEAFLSQFVKRKCSVIPVILHGCKKNPELPVFLGSVNWVDFRKEDPDPFEQLMWGITGRRPT